MGRIVFIILLIMWICFGTYHWTCNVNNDCADGFAFFNFGKNKIDRPAHSILKDANGPVNSFSIIGDGFSVKSNENITFDIKGYNPKVPVNISKEFLKVKEYLFANPNVRLNIIGHYQKSDPKPVGYPDLGLARAKSVKSFLLRQKFNATQLNVTSAQKNMPIVLDEKVIDGVRFTFSKVKPSKGTAPNKTKANTNNAIVTTPRANVESNNNNTPKSKVTNLKRPISNRTGVKKRPAKASGLRKKSVKFTQSAKADKGNVYELTKVNFLPKAIGPDRNSFSELYTLANFLKINSKAKIEIGCNVKQTVDSKTDETLSTNRARALSTFISGKGIAQNRVTFKGYGSSLNTRKDKIQILIK